MDSITTINHLPQEVLYMIMNLLVYPERIRCRLVSKHFMFAASYVFKVVHFSSRERVKFFAEAIKKNPCIATHVQIIKVDNAALLRAINQTDIKQACTNVKEIEILNTQGKGTWAQHLLPYKNVQHTPVLLDAANAKIVLDNYAKQMLTLRLGGKYLLAMSLDDICQLIKTVPHTRTLGLHYPFKEKHRELDRDLPHSYKFKDLNTLLKQVSGLMRFELKNCEVADFSLLYQDRRLPVELLQHVRELPNARKTHDLFDPLLSLKHLHLDNVKVTYVTSFVQSILKAFINLESLDMQFVPRDYLLESNSGTRWDNFSSNDWTDFEMTTSKLKKLSLSQTDARLSITGLLRLLGGAGARLQDITIVKAGPGTSPWDILTIIANSFGDTLEHLVLDMMRGIDVQTLDRLRHLKTASFTYVQNEHISQITPIAIVQKLPDLTKMTLGYGANYSKVLLDSTCTPIINLTSITLDRVVMNQGQLKQFFLPLINLKEAIFRYCVFEYSKDCENNEDLQLAEIFDQRPSTGMPMELVRKKFFDRIKDEDERLKIEDAKKESEYKAAKERNSDDTSLPAYWTPRRYNLQVRSLSLEHLGLHDCRLRDIVGGLSTARTIRNFEVVQDRRSGIHTCYDVDRAYHEKKHCNPHIHYNNKRVSEDTMAFHFTHEFGGTTGKNNYIVSRPTFIISVFSLEKLSIRPNAVMSIYFTGVDGNRLKDCDTALKEELERQNGPDRNMTIFNPLTAFNPTFNPSTTIYNPTFLDSIQNLDFDHPITYDTATEKFDQEIDKLNEALAKALQDAAEQENGFTLDKTIFDSELFEAKSHSSCMYAKPVEEEESPRKRNKKTLPIRPF